MNPIRNHRKKGGKIRKNRIIRVHGNATLRPEGGKVANLPLKGNSVKFRDDKECNWTQNGIKNETPCIMSLALKNMK